MVQSKRTSRREQRAIERMMTTRPDTVAHAVAFYAELVETPSTDPGAVLTKYLSEREDAVPILMYTLGYMNALAIKLREQSTESRAEADRLIDIDKINAMWTVAKRETADGH